MTKKTPSLWKGFWQLADPKIWIASRGGDHWSLYSSSERAPNVMGLVCGINSMSLHILLVHHNCSYKKL